MPGRLVGVGQCGGCEGGEAVLQAVGDPEGTRIGVRIRGVVGMVRGVLLHGRDTTLADMDAPSPAVPMTPLPATLRSAVVLTGVAAAGTLLLAIAHLGIEIPVLSALGPQGGAVPPAVVAFTLATALFAGVGYGLARRSRLAWGVGLGVSALSILSGIGQFRGVVSAIGIGLSVLLIGLLLASPSRDAVR